MLSTVGLLAAGGVLFTAPLGAQQAPQLPVPVSPVPIGAPMAHAPIPTLSAKEAQAASRVVAGNAQLNKLVQGVAYSVSRVGPWTREDGSLAGAVVQLEFTQPIDIENAEWVTADFAETAKTSPSIRMQPLTVRNMSAMTVLVDLGSQQIISETPAPPRTTRGEVKSAAGPQSVELPPGVTIPLKPSKD